MALEISDLDDQLWAVLPDLPLHSGPSLAMVPVPAAIPDGSVSRRLAMLS